MGQAKRVAVVFPLISYGGVQSCVFSLIRGLNQIGIVPDVLWDIPPKRELLIAEKCQAGFRAIGFRIPTPIVQRLPFSLRYGAHLINSIDVSKYRKDYDFFYLFTTHALVQSDIPHVYYLSGPPLLPQLESAPSGIKGLPYRFLRLAYRHFIHLHRPIYDYHPQLNYVINAQYTADLFKAAHGSKLPVVHPPIKMKDKYFSIEDIGKRQLTVFFSRIVPYKRPEMVLHLAQHFPEQPFRIIGSVSPNRTQYYESLRARAIDKRLHNIDFHANPSNAEVCAVLKQARFYVFPGVNEHFGMTTPEIIASGVVPFVHDSGGQREIVPNPRLRFADGEFLTKYSALLKASDWELNQIRDELNQYVRARFREEVFLSKMLAFIN